MLLVAYQKGAFGLLGGQSIILLKEPCRETEWAAQQQAHEADRLIEFPIVACLGFAAFRFAVMTLRNPAADKLCQVPSPDAFEE